MDFFETVSLAAPDPTFDLARAYLQDNRSTKINLGIGSYRTASLDPLILHTVKEVEKKMVLKEKDKEYLPIEGLARYLEVSHALVFGEPLSPETAAVQSVGGTHALRLAAEFLQSIGLKKLYLPMPTWGNHKQIFIHALLEVEEIPYYDKKLHCFDKSGFIEAMEKMPKGSILLLQGCCHNPTGMDPNREEWSEILKKVKERQLFPLFDLAYQGFGRGLEEDVEAIRLFRKEGIDMAVALSFSKNFGLYAERTGALFFHCQGSRQKEAVVSQLKRLIRSDVSNPPCHGAYIITEILGEQPLSLAWSQEVRAMRERIEAMRTAFTTGLEARIGGRGSFAHMNKALGMFAFTGLRSDQVERLISEYGIYMLKNGRVNLAGLNMENLNYVIEAIIAVSEL